MSGTIECGKKSSAGSTRIAAVAPLQNVASLPFRRRNGGNSESVSVGTRSAQARAVPLPGDRRVPRWICLVHPLLMALLNCGPVRAQVNVEPLRQQVTQRKFGARLNASASTYAGNTQGVVFGGAALIGGRTQRNFGYVDLSGDYSRLAGVVSVAKWFVHLRHNFEVNADLWWEEYAQLESDRFRRVQLRELVGTGPRFRLLHGQRFELFYGTSYMVEHTALDSADPNPEGQGTFERWSNYLAATYRPDERIVLSTVTYVQPRIDRFSDFKILSVSGADLSVTRRVHSKLDATARYESAAPSDVRNADLELKSSLEVVF